LFELIRRRHDDELVSGAERPGRLLKVGLRNADQRVGALGLQDDRIDLVGRSRGSAGLLASG
jgi:hypothetical protein